MLGAEPGAEIVDDAAAVIESLPPTLRAQVLADAHESVLQVLPQNVVAEARRLRANFEHQVCLISDILYVFIVELIHICTIISFKLFLW